MADEGVHVSIRASTGLGRGVERTLVTDESSAGLAFGEYIKTVPTRISDRVFPPGTAYQTAEGLKAEDEETRAALDVQGHVYPIRESVFRATYAPLPGTRGPVPVVCPACSRDDHADHTRLDGSCGNVRHEDTDCACALRLDAFGRPM